MLRANVEAAENGYILYLFDGTVSSSKDKRFVAKTEAEVVALMTEYFKQDKKEK